jgi:hypothetical protein
MNIKSRLSTLAAVWLITGAPSALAASTTDLTVTGFITPSACTPSLSAGGIINYGQIPVTDLQPNRPTWLSDKQLDMSINCAAKTLYALMPRDNRPEGQSYSGFQGFALAMISPGLPLGSYYLGVQSPPLADGVAVDRLYSENNGLTWRTYGASEFSKPDTLSAFGDSSTGRTAPIPIKDLSLSFEVRTLIYATHDMPVSEGIPIDGFATFELRYL